MEWYCAVWNSDKVSSVMGAQAVYERLCEGNTSFVSEFIVVQEFFEDVKKNYPFINAHKLEGAVMLNCDFEKAAEANEIIQRLAKKHGLSYFEPENLIFIQ